jgi:hypothetical protein
MRQIHKEYKNAFVLEPTKLTRLVGVIHERLADHEHTELKDRFELFYGMDGREELDRLEDVLAIENSRRRQVRRLVLTCSGTPEGEGRPEHEVFIDFAATPFAAKPDSSDRVVNVAVRSDESGWASRTLSEVEEQLERSWVSYVGPMLALLGVVVFLLFLAVEYLPSGQVSKTSQDLSRVMWLAPADLDRIEQMVKQGHPITDDELREIWTRQLDNLLEDRRPKPVPERPEDRRRLLLIIAPVLAMLGCLGVLAGCYPRSVYLWGDEIGRHARLLRRRHWAWGVVVGIAVIGLGANLLTKGLSP